MNRFTAYPASSCTLGLCVVLLAGLFPLAGCRLPGALHDLEGTWTRFQTNGKTRLEIWARQDARTLHGLGLRVSGADTVHLESLAIRKEDGKWKYIATVPDQNNGMPVPFTCTALSRHEATFENPAHDFPQRIVYTISSRRSGKESTSVDSLIVKLGTMTETGGVMRFSRK